MLYTYFSLSASGAGGGVRGGDLNRLSTRSHSIQIPDLSGRVGGGGGDTVSRAWWGGGDGGP